MYLYRYNYYIVEREFTIRVNLTRTDLYDILRILVLKITLYAFLVYKLTIKFSHVHLLSAIRKRR